MTDAHENTPTTETERIDFQANYDKYGLQPIDDGTVVLRIDQDSHVFEHIGAIRHEQTGVVLERYIRSKSVGENGSYEPVEFVSAEKEGFESQLQAELFNLIYDEKVAEDQADALADDLAESIADQFNDRLPD